MAAIRYGVKTFQQTIRTRDFVITAEPRLSPTTTAGELRACIRKLRTAVDAIQVGDNTDGRAHLAPLAAAAIARQADMDTVVQFSCRDRNRIALQSDLLGAAALGISSLLITRGEALPEHARKQSKPVFEFGAKRLIGMAQLIGADNNLVAPPGFFLGARVTVFEPPDDWHPKGLQNKANAGSNFLQTQPCLDLPLLKRYMAAVVASKMLERISILVEVPLLDSMDTLDQLQSRSRNPVVPDGIRLRLASADNTLQEGIEICAQVLREVAAIPGVCGANIVFRCDPDCAVDAIRLAGVREFD